MHEILRCFDDFLLDSKKKQTIPQGHEKASQTLGKNWTRTMEGEIKINFDATLRLTGTCVVAITRGANGNAIEGKTTLDIEEDPLVAEAMVVR